MDTPVRSWAIDRPLTSPFARPRGWRGRLAGRVMRWVNKQDEVLGILDVQAGDRVLEVGYGPGALVGLLVERTGAALVQGVDLSPEMRDLAARANRSDRVDLRVGSAARTGLPDESVDLVVSVNNVLIWPDLEAGLRELHRVLRPGGTVVIAWHGGTAQPRVTRRLRLPEELAGRIEAGLKEMFADVTRQRLTALEVFKAAR